MSVFKQTLAATSRMALNGAAGVACLSLFFHNMAGLANIEGDSMYPALDGGSNTLIVQKWNTHPMLRQGDVVILKSPVDPEVLLVKRLIGLQGQTIPVPIDPTSVPPEALQFIPSSKPLKIPLGHVWLEGDNANQSIDSRHFGAVPQALVVGIARVKIDFDHWTMTRISPPVLWNAHTRKISPPNQDLFGAKQSSKFSEAQNGCSGSPDRQSPPNPSHSTLQSTLKRPVQGQPQFYHHQNGNQGSNDADPIASQQRRDDDPQPLVIDPAVKFTFCDPNNTLNPYRVENSRLAENDLNTKLTLNQIGEKRSNNRYHQDAQQEIKFQKYLSSYDRVHNPQLESVYNQVNDQLHQETLTMGTKFKSSQAHIVISQQQQPPVQSQPQYDNSMAITTTTTTTSPVLAPGQEWRMTKQDQLDLLLPQLSPNQRQVLLADYSKTADITNIHSDQSHSRSYLDNYKSPVVGTAPKTTTINENVERYDTATAKPVFTFKWNNDPILSPDLPTPNPTTITTIPIKPQSGQVRTHLNPYLDVIPNENTTVVVPTAYLSGIQQRGSVPPTNSQQQPSSSSS